MVWSPGSRDYCSRPAQGLKDLNHGKQLTQVGLCKRQVVTRTLSKSRRALTTRALHQVVRLPS